MRKRGVDGLDLSQPSAYTSSVLVCDETEVAESETADHGGCHSWDAV